MGIATEVNVCLAFFLSTLGKREKAKKSKNKKRQNTKRIVIKRWTAAKLENGQNADEDRKKRLLPKKWVNRSRKKEVGKTDWKKVKVTKYGKKQKETS